MRKNFIYIYIGSSIVRAGISIKLISRSLPEVRFIRYFFFSFCKFHSDMQDSFLFVFEVRYSGVPFVGSCN